MMLEIGSEFWTGCTPLNGSGVSQFFPAGMDTHYTLCGRTALELVLRDLMQYSKVNKAYLPSYCCHTMIEPFLTKGIQVAFYDVFFTDIGIECDFSENNDSDLVFAMDYFGFREEKIAEFTKKQKALGKVVVYDATHSMFCENMDYSNCDYVFGSFRKWFGVNAGFCAKRGGWQDFPLLTQNDAYTSKRNIAFEDKMRFMAGKPVEKQGFLDAFSSAEERLETDYVGYAPDANSAQIVQRVNVDFIREIRRENASYTIAQINALTSGIVRSPYQQIKKGECPLFVPLWVEPKKRASLRHRLIENRVYLPIHWPLSKLHQTNNVSQSIYDTELSFVCDQRYSREDMKRAIEIIRSF